MRSKIPPRIVRDGMRLPPLPRCFKWASARSDCSMMLNSYTGAYKFTNPDGSHDGGSNSVLKPFVETILTYAVFEANCVVSLTYWYWHIIALLFLKNKMSSSLFDRQYVLFLFLLSYTSYSLFLASMFEAWQTCRLASFTFTLLCTCVDQSNKEELREELS